MTRTEYISGLRAVAKFFEAHPDITVMPSPYLFATIWKSDEIDPKPILAAVAKASGSAKKIYTDTEFQVKIQIGCFSIRYDAPRDMVCERVVTGTRVIPEHVLPAREETFVPKKVEEIYEWRCPESLLAGVR